MRKKVMAGMLAVMLAGTCVFNGALPAVYAAEQKDEETEETSSAPKVPEELSGESAEPVSSVLTATENLAVDDTAAGGESTTEDIEAESDSEKLPELFRLAPELNLYQDTLDDGLMGMRQELPLARNTAELKADNAAHDMYTMLAGAVPGEDYVEQSVLLYLGYDEYEEQRSYAEEVAAAFNGSLQSYTLGNALIRLPATAEEAQDNARVALKREYEEMDRESLIALTQNEEIAALLSDDGEEAPDLDVEGRTARLIDLAVEAELAEHAFTGITVAEAVQLSAERATLPAVEPSFIYHLTLAEEEDGEEASVTFADDGGEAPMTFADDEDEALVTFADGEDEAPVTFADDGTDELESCFNDPFLRTSNSMYQWYHDMLHSEAVWSRGFAGNADIRVSVIDSGVKADHPDLTGHVVQYAVEGSQGTTPLNPNQHSHGTHVAGIIGATANNSAGGSGIAPGVTIQSYNCSLIEGSATAIDGAAKTNALLQSIRNKADIINMSLGGSFYSANEQSIILQAVEKGITIVCAMGNEGGIIKAYPAGFKGVVAVGAVGRTGAKTPFSNYGSWCTVAAPGNGICSCLASNIDSVDYGSMNGTSQATPVVAGACALYMSTYGRVGVEKMTSLLKQSTQPAKSTGLGAGIIDLAKLMGIAGKIAPEIAFGDPATGKTVPKSTYSSLSDTMVLCLRGAGDIYYNIGGRVTVKNGQVTAGRLGIRNKNSSDYSGVKSLSGIVPGSYKVFAARLNDDGTLSDQASVSFKVTASSGGTAAVTGVVFEQKKLELSCNQKVAEQADPGVTLTSAGGGTITLAGLKEGTDYVWQTTNPAVADVLAGKVVARGTGKCSITLKLKNASGSSATCAVTVKRSPDALTIRGQRVVQPGKRVTYQVVYNPKNVTKKDVKWSVVKDWDDDTESPLASIDGKGRLTVTGNSGYFYVKAYSPSGGCAYRLSVNISDSRASSVGIRTTDNRGTATVNGKGNLTQVTLYTVNHPDTYFDDTRLEVKDEGAVVPNWYSSNEAVATVSQLADRTYVVRAVRPGTAKIICDAADGSGKKASFTVRVVIPASRVAIYEKNLKKTDREGNLYVAAGRSISYGAVMGDAYGKPTSSKVKWELWSYTGLSASAARKQVKLSNGGVLRIGANALNYATGSDFPTVTLRAYAADGSGLYAQKTVTVLYGMSGIQKMKYTSGGRKYAFQNEQDGLRNGTPYVKAENDRAVVVFSTYRMEKRRYGRRTYNLRVSTPCLAWDVTSSDPDVATATVNATDSSYDQNKLIFVGGWKKGTTKITCTALNGSGKKVTYTVKNLRGR
ncbi:MAG: S8 family serine peptidase [Lachnospiraceae bacterium]|nr:S8 family serine peptidase [Lachnospiraceae bacterium]